jgi:3-deoxy-D-manno-octulosonic-acid transferase
MSKKLQNQINHIKKIIVNQNLSNNSITTYNKLGEIEHSLYRYNQLSNAGLKDEAKTENTRIRNLINNFNNYQI